MPHFKTTQSSASCSAAPSPNIVAQLQLWWETAQRSMRQTHGADYAADCVSREEYIRVSRLLSRTMLEDFDSGEAQRVRALPSAPC